MNCQTFSTGFNSGGTRRQEEQRDVGGDDELGRHVPAGAVEDQHGMGTGIDGA
jgi:hypothetical protein